MNPFRGVLKQLRPTRDLLGIQNGPSNSAIERPQRLQRIDHLSACCEIRFACLLQDFNRKRVIWINEDHYGNSEWCACERR